MQIKEEAGAGLELAEIWYRRLILLILFGVVHSYLLVWPGDILFSYGMIGLLLFPFRNSRPRNLILLAVGILFAGMVMNIGETRTAKREQKNYFEVLEMFNKGESVPHSVLMDYYGWIERYAVWLLVITCYRQLLLISSLSALLNMVVCSGMNCITSY